MNAHYKEDLYAYIVADEYSFAPVVDTYYETNYNPENLYYTNFANKKDNTNCLVLFQPEDFSE